MVSIGLKFIIKFVSIVLKFTLLECSQGNYKKMDGDPDGLTEKVKMDLTIIKVDIGRLKTREIGMGVQIYSEKLLKPLTTSLKNKHSLKKVQTPFFTILVFPWSVLVSCSFFQHTLES